MTTTPKDSYLTAPQVRARYGGISDMTLWRWIHDANLNFPRPEYIKQNRYWQTRGLDAWDRERASNQEAA